MKPHPALSVIIALIITALFASFLFSVSSAAFNEGPDYSDFCPSQPRPDPIRGEDPEVECPDIDFTSEFETCNEQGGHLVYNYTDGCAVSAYCEMCGVEYDQARDRYDNGRFLVVTGLAVVSIAIALYIVRSVTTLGFYIASGVIFGSLAAVLIVTLQTFGSFQPWLRPFVLLGEIALVITVALKLFEGKLFGAGDTKKGRARKKK